MAGYGHVPGLHVAVKIHKIVLYLQSRTLKLTMVYLEEHDHLIVLRIIL